MSPLNDINLECLADGYDVARGAFFNGSKYWQHATADK